MSGNIYHIIHFKPGVERWEMSVGYEKLVQKLIHSGRFRIDGGEDKLNFARLYIPNLDISMTFSHREIHEPALVKKTKEAIAEQLSGSISGRVLGSKTQFYLDTLVDEIKKYAQPTAEEEMQLARLVVQAAHPAVIELALLDRVEIFLSYSQNIGDVLDVQTWQSAGSNSGMQSLKGQEKAVFISCGGNPLRENKDPKAEYGDGRPAIARILIIGGQEIGHYSDIMRDATTGQQVPSRYSADIYGTNAKKEVKLGRIKDIKRGNLIMQKFADIGLRQLLQSEKVMKFYREVNRGGFVVFLEFLKLHTKRIILVFKARKMGLHKIFNKFGGERYPALMLEAMCEDMLFNLAPKADVYSSKNKDVEEAIACIEALARVPQQANKWGHYLAKVFMKDLYTTYYEKIIPGCINAYEALSGQKFVFDRKRIGRSLFEKIKALLKK